MITPLEAAKATLDEMIAKYNPSKEDLKGLYFAWYHMHDRCSNPHSQAYPQYGGAGIAVTSNKWAIRENFIAWGLRNNYKKGMSLDRIDGSEGYEPNNCRWTTKSEQCRNRPNYVLRLPDGRLACDVARKHGIKHTNTWKSRIKKGWDLLTAVTTPVKSYSKGINC